MRGAPSAPRPASESPRRRRRKEAFDRTPEPPRTRPRAPRPPARSFGGLGHRLADAYLFSAAFLVLELCAVAIGARAELAGGFELVTAFRAILPIGIALAAPVAIVGAVIAHAARGAESRGWRATGALVSALGAGAVAFGVSTGRHLAGGIRPVFVAAVALGAAGLFWLAAPLVARFCERSKPKQRLLVIAVAAVALLLAVEMANVLVLPRLYPAFHLGLSAVALFAVAALTLGYDVPPSRAGTRAYARPFGAMALFALSAALTPMSAARLALADNLRLVYVEHAPALGRAVEAASRAVPPASMGTDDRELVGDAAQSIDLTGWDVLLVSVDALRADHLGAYGYGRATSPNIDRLAAQGVVFDAAYTTTPHTSYAVTSLMTGKYMRPLILQGLGADSETLADHLRRYGYKTAAFFPPAVFFIDEERFEHFEKTSFGFEYEKKEFASPELRAEQVKAYLSKNPGDERRFLWVHLFEPHEPYEAHAEHPFGGRDIDRYDSEIAEADQGVGDVVSTVLAARPKTLVIITADHGEEFGDHGGRYHGTTVYEEQVRVPLVVVAPGLLKPSRVDMPVQLIDLLPTILRGLSVPRPARVRGRDIGAALLGKSPATDQGQAFAETDTMTMLAEGPFRLVCERRVSACTLYNVKKDPGETRDLSGNHPDVVARMRGALTRLEASHGRYEERGLREEGKGWPEVLRRGIAGDGDAAADVAGLLDDADVTIRRKAAEVLFDLKRPEPIAALKLALERDEDKEVRSWAALALTRLGESAPLTYELVDGPDQRFRRLAALALGEEGDEKGAAELVAWWRAAFPHERAKKREPLDVERAKEILAVFKRIKPREALVPLIESLPDVRLRPFIADALAALGDDAARVPLADQLLVERYQTARVAIAEALIKLGAGPELLAPLTSLLGMPDPLPGGLGMAIHADLLKHIGGPIRDAELARLEHFATSGVSVDFFVPKLDHDQGVRIVCRAKSTGPGEITVGRRLGLPSGSEKKAPIPARAPELDSTKSLTLSVGTSDAPVEVFATLPESLDVHPGKQVTLVFYATQPVSLEACALVPLRDELPPPPKERWTEPRPDEP